MGNRGGSGGMEGRIWYICWGGERGEVVYGVGLRGRGLGIKLGIWRGWRREFGWEMGCGDEE